MGEKIRWGLMGAGAILERWMQGAAQVPDMEIAAVASRTQESARRAAGRWKIPKTMTYDEMIHDPDIDVVYVPVPHTQHQELSMKAMENGKHVLVEKPAGISASQFQKMAECARRHNVFLMEAVWTRFFPIMDTVLTKIKEGEIGDVRHVQAAFSFRVPDDCTSRLVDPDRAGGGLLDVGVYPLHLARMIYGRAPESITGLCAMNTDGLHLQVDEQASFVARYDNGALATMSCGIRTQMLDTAFIYGTRGYMILPVFWKPTRVTIVTGGRTEVIEQKVPQTVPGAEDEGYQYEIAHVNDCIRRGVKESPLLPFAETMDVLKQTDRLRRDWGIRFPQEM